MIATNEYIDRYRAALAAATDDQIRHARAWYCDARKVAETLVGLRPDWSLEVASCVISAFSPRERWSSNVTKATMYALHTMPKGLRSHIVTASRCEREGFNGLRGLKTNAFARAIFGDCNAVVIDTWMIKAAGLTRKSVTAKQYRILADAVRIVAHEAGLDPAVAQAAIWIVVRGSAT